MHSIAPKKSLGQNFLVDATIIHRLLQAIHPEAEDTLIEIGPGLGALTYPLLMLVKQMTVIEIDARVIAPLKERAKTAKGSLIILNKDVLSVDFKIFFKHQKLRIVGNLPYSISTPLLFHLIKYSDSIKDMHFMLQKEVADRITAPVGNKIYGRLSIMLQYFCKTQTLFDVAPQAFKPRPKVQSTVIRLTPFDKLPLVAKDFEYFSLLVRTAFNHRRKTLQNSLKSLDPQPCFAKAGIQPTIRPEQVSVQGFVALANSV